MDVRVETSVSHPVVHRQVLPHPHVIQTPRSIPHRPGATDANLPLAHDGSIHLLRTQAKSPHADSRPVQKGDNAEVAESPLIDEAELEAEDAGLEEVNREGAEALPEEDRADAEAQPQLTEAPRRDIQEELMLVREILIHGIKLRDPQSWSQLERLLVSRWDAAL